MDKILLLESAQKLKQVSFATADEYHQNSEHLIAKMNTIMSERPDVESLVGANNLNMMKDNHFNHAQFISSILKYHNSNVLVDNVLWVFRAYRSHGFTVNYWTVQLNTWITVLKEALTPECFAEVYPYYNWLQINIPIFAKLSDEKAEAQNTLL